MKLAPKWFAAAVRNNRFSGTGALRLQLADAINVRLLAQLFARSRKATLTRAALLIARLEPVLHSHVQRLKTPRASCLNLHPSEGEPPELYWRHNLRDLVIELGFAPDPGEWIFFADDQEQWRWEYTRRGVVVARSTGYFCEFKRCMEDANEQGFSSLFAFYSTRAAAQGGYKVDVQI
jgi:hypothetical protein